MDLRTAMGRLGGLLQRGRTDPAAGPPATTVPAPPLYDWAETLHVQQMAAVAAAGELDLLLVGDSLAQHWPPEAWSSEACASESCAPWRTLSLGIGGDGTQHVLWRVGRIAWGACRPRRLLVVAGTNNLLAADAPADIAAGVAAVSAALGAARPEAEGRVLLPPPLHVGPPDGIARWRALRADLAARFGPRLIDAAAALGPPGPAPNPNYQADGVHFSERGYGVLTAASRASFR